ncbi:MAG: DUF3084 domain-containing protein [bacterium]
MRRKTKKIISHLTSPISLLPFPILRYNGLQMTYGITLIVLLIFISGLIAYVGDRVGRRVGKRRVSIFNLRPRHTSTIITIITGILIVSVTLGALFLVSKNARTSFFGLEKLKDRLQETKKEVRIILKTIDKKSEELNKLRRSEKELEKSQARLRKDVEGLKRQRDTLAKEKESLEREKVSLEREKRSLEGEVQKKAAMLGDAAKTCLYADVLYTRDQPLARITVPDNAGYGEIQEQLEEIVRKLENTAVERGAVVQSASRAYLNEQLKGLKKRLDSIGDAVVEIRSLTNVLSGEPFIVRLSVVENRLVFRSGEELEKITVNAGLGKKQVESRLEEAMLAVSTRARAAGIVPDTETGKVASVSAKRYYQVIDELTDRKSKTTVVIFAQKDTRIADKLQVDFKIGN